MPVIIENMSPRGWPDDVEHAYLVRLNTRVVAAFVHRRDEGLAACLRRAAEAVESGFTPDDEPAL